MELNWTLPVDIGPRSDVTTANLSRLTTPFAVLSRVTIVTPVGPSDDHWRRLAHDLIQSGVGAELVLVATTAPPLDVDEVISQWRSNARWLTTAAGRARQMNYGAAHASRPFIWFLHADSVVPLDAILALERSLEQHPQSLHYFNLAFQDDGPRRMRLNELGARFRSRYLGLPFGDQGLCMSRDTFQRLGGFDETAAYGEDHLLVWAAHRHRVPLRQVDGVIQTSARKYRTQGWLRTTLVHVWRTWKQAIPQALRLMRNRWR